ncbi:UDP-glucuronate 5-epimerase [Jannaschia pagri]|uniref:UDP-glucuronate 5-epimerase n=1 Tax=Jannaschia pagri TaxID=2829797 RepID=A0ABQ4NLF1_9RHOB|nr:MULTISPECIES: NAD-dependent epimerase/dehydratase family protein [unclassified Jannaschia]GIT91410.1 UDP-glucuronate 5-epimerase [Jannaschia sp. AI_61]GIT95244.1 UDP-glucuronate 5-epimerase [Jannaschia sp. AI_62]
MDRSATITAIGPRPGPNGARIVVTGSAGFIGFHLSRLLLSQGHSVHGIDGMTDYYDVSLKRRRHAMLAQIPGFSATHVRLEDREALDAAIDQAAPDVIVHLAAQAGVRHSLDVPRAYMDANITGSFNVLEAAKRHRVRHLLVASSSSVYGANTEMPFREVHRTDTPLNVYGATKKAVEDLGHVYAHLHDIPVTMFRFFTVYGPWGRPDMALFSFAEAMAHGRAINVHNHGQMERDFTYIDDLVQAIGLLVERPPERPKDGSVSDWDSLSTVAPYRVVNIGNGSPVPLMAFIRALEDAMGIEARKTMLPAQPGEVLATWADTSLLQRLTGFKPQTDHRQGVAEFIKWWSMWRSGEASQAG